MTWLFKLIWHSAVHRVVISLCSCSCWVQRKYQLKKKSTFCEEVQVCCYIYRWLVPYRKLRWSGRAPFFLSFFVPSGASSALKSWAKKAMEGCNRPTTVSFSGSLFLHSHPACCIPRGMCWYNQHGTFFGWESIATLKSFFLKCRLIVPALCISSKWASGSFYHGSCYIIRVNHQS